MDIRMLGALALVFVVGAFIISIGGEVLTSLQGTQTANTVAYNATGKGLSGITSFANWLPLLALVIVASIVIGVIVRYMGGAGA